MVSPKRLATHSVAWLSKPANGMMATALRAKMMTGLKPAAATAIPAGTKINSTLTQLWQMAVFVWPTKRTEPFFMRTNRPGLPCSPGCFSSALLLLLSSWLGSVAFSAAAAPLPPSVAVVAPAVAADEAPNWGFTWACCDAKGSAASLEASGVAAAVVWERFESCWEGRLWSNA